MTLHQRNAGDDCRFDIGDSPYNEIAGRSRFDLAYIMNDKGRTVETLDYVARPQSSARAA